MELLVNQSRERQLGLVGLSWLTKKGGRLKPDKTAREGDDPFNVSGREPLSGAVSYIAVASLALEVVSWDSAAHMDDSLITGINDPRKLCSCFSGGHCLG